MMIGEIKRAEMPKSLSTFKEEVANFCTEVGSIEYDRDKAIEVLDKLYDYFADCSKYEKTMSDTTSLAGIKSNLNREIERIKNVFPDIVKEFNPEDYKIGDLNMAAIEEEIEQQ